MKLLSISIIRKEPEPIQEFLKFFSCTLVERTSVNIRQVIVQEDYYGYVYNHPQGLGGVMISQDQYPERVAFTLLNKILEEFLAKYPRIHWMSTQGSSNLPASRSQTDTSSIQAGFSHYFSSLYNNDNSSLSTQSSTSENKRAASSLTNASSTLSTPPNPTPFPSLKLYLVKYQDPSEADAIMKVQKEIDETKGILHKTIEGLLERGEKLDQLVDKSNNLSLASKQFYKYAKKTNACQCSVM